jgi:uncharacterized repeat protein (TIGR01451 family)
LWPAPVVSNQANIRAAGLSAELSDADDDDSNGDQPTLVQVGGGVPVLQLTKAVQDENGGAVQAGDTVRYTLQVRNLSAGADFVTVVDQLPAGVLLAAANPQDAIVLPPGAAVAVADVGARTQLTISNVQVQAGETVALTIRAKLPTAVSDGTSVCNTGFARGQGDQVQSDPACVAIGATAGTGVVRGRVWEDVGGDDGVFQPERDLILADMQVLLLPPGSEGGKSAPGAVRSAVIGADGRFAIAGVPPGARVLRVLAKSGVQYLETTLDVPGAQGLDVDLTIRPTGRIYDAEDGELVAGAQLYLFYDLTDPIAPGQQVPADVLPVGQQGQRTDASGAYVLQPPAGRSYRIGVSPGSGRSFPSRLLGAEPSVVLLGGDGLVAADAVPKAAAKPRYLLRFSRQGAETPAQAPPQPRHNHIPVDAFADAIQVSIKFSKSQVAVGEAVSATVRVVNGSTSAIAVDTLTGNGGAELRALLPAGLALVPGSVRMVQTVPGQASLDVPLAPLQAPALLVRRQSPVLNQAVGLDLPSGGELTLQMLAIAGATAKVGGDLQMRAQLYDTAGLALVRGGHGAALWSRPIRCLMKAVCWARSFVTTTTMAGKNLQNTALAGRAFMPM